LIIVRLPSLSSAKIIIAIYLGKGFDMPAIIDSNHVLSNLEQAIRQGFKRGSTLRASDDEEDGVSRITRVRLS
jgi:hypothetical protein